MNARIADFLCAAALTFAPASIFSFYALPALADGKTDNDGCISGATVGYCTAGCCSGTKLCKEPTLDEHNHACHCE